MTIKNLQVNGIKSNLTKYKIDSEVSKKILYASIDRPWNKFYSEEVMSSTLPSMTMYDYICQNAFENLNRPALNYFDNVISYSEFFDNVEITAATLIDYGVKKGDIVTLITPTIPESIYLLYAINKIGAISNCVDPRTSKEGIECYVGEAKSDLVFVIDVASPKVRNLKNKYGVKTIVNISPTESMTTKAQLQQLKLMYKKAMEESLSGNTKLYSSKVSCMVSSFKKVITDLQASKKTFGYSDECLQWSEFIGKKVEFIKPYQSLYGEGDAPAVIVHTGGTTGMPKGVLLSNNNLNSAAFDCINAGYDFKKEHNWLNIMPLFIAYGCGNGLHLPLVCKMEVIVIPAFEAEMMPDLLNKYHPNHMVGVPSHYGTIIKSDKLKNEDLSYVIAPTVGGDSMSLDLERETNEFLESHNCPYKVVKGYGMTEVTAAVCACTSNETNELGSVGIPFPHSVISIFDPDTLEELSLTSDFDDKHIGEVCVTGPNVMLKYYNNDEETAKIMKKHSDGRIWIHSGDLGYMNENGELFIIGRMKDMIIRHDGFKIFPNFIENVVKQDPAVLECKAVGVKDTSFSQGELPYVYIVLKDDALSDGQSIDSIEERISLLCQLQIQEYSLPTGFEFIDKFPQTNIGKINVTLLKEKANLNNSVKKLVKNN